MFLSFFDPLQVPVQVRRSTVQLIATTASPDIRHVRLQTKVGCKEYITDA